MRLLRQVVPELAGAQQLRPQVVHAVLQQVEPLLVVHEQRPVRTS